MGSFNSNKHQKRNNEMKKLILATALMCVATCGYSATVNWASQGIQISGDFDLGEGDFAAGFSVYLFADSGTYTQAAMSSMIAKNEGWNAAFTSSAYLGNAVADSDGVIAPLGATVDNGDFSGYLVIFDNSDYTKAEYAFVSGVYTANDNSMHKMTLDYDGDTWVNALDYDTKGTVGSNWQALGSSGEGEGGSGAVPEPTSGLLLLLGVAGLALKRKCA
jgi:hypothetical protein